MDTNQKAIFAAGCFWGIEAAFQKTSGVVSTRVGYIGGALQNPTYEQVCAGNSGHAEAVELIFDEKALSYSALLDIFWRLHNPTQLNRQGPDVGSQYRSAVFYLDETQRLAAEESKTREGKNHQNPVVTEITATGEFWPAEDYHQSYIKRRRGFF